MAYLCAMNKPQSTGCYAKEICMGSHSLYSLLSIHSNDFEDKRATNIERLLHLRGK